MPPEPILSVAMRSLRAAGLFLLDTAIGLVLMAGLRASQRWFNFVFGDDAPKFFDILPLKWIFEAGEFGVLVVFLSFGIYEVVAQLRR
jgi:hypothetical protein